MTDNVELAKTVHFSIEKGYHTWFKITLTAVKNNFKAYRYDIIVEMNFTAGHGKITAVILP